MVLKAHLNSEQKRQNNYFNSPYTNSIGTISVKLDLIIKDE